MIRGVLMQGSVGIYSPHEELALWERWEPGPDPPFAIKGKKSASCTKFPVPGIAGHPFQTAAPAVKRDEADSITAIKNQEESGKDRTVYLGKIIILSSPIKARESAAAGLRGKHCLG